MENSFWDTIIFPNYISFSSCLPFKQRPHKYWWGSYGLVGEGFWKAWVRVSGFHWSGFLSFMGVGLEWSLGSSEDGLLFFLLFLKNQVSGRVNNAQLGSFWKNEGTLPWGWEWQQSSCLCFPALHLSFHSAASSVETCFWASISHGHTIEATFKGHSHFSTPSKLWKENFTCSS